MKKVSEITQFLGLTQSQIGLYIRENLIHPVQDAKKHFDAGVLTESEVQQLQAVQCLRIHEFGLEEIKYLSICAEVFHDYLQQKSEEKKVLYSNMEDVLSAVATLQNHAPEGKEREKLCKEIKRYRYLPQSANQRPTFLQEYASKIALSVIVLILLAYLFSQLYRPAAKVMAVLALFAIGALIAFVCSIVYLMKRKPPKEYSFKSIAVIEKIDRVTEFDASFAMGKSIVPGSGFREQGQGGVWQFVFMLWNEIRPDHYYPILKFSYDGKERIATFRFGGYKHSWNAGDTIPVFLSEADNGIVYPEVTSFMVKKSILALCIAALLGSIFCMEISPVFRAANHEFVIHNPREILFGLEDDIYEGTELVSDSEILLDFTHFTGSKKMALACRAGDCIYLETENKADGLDIPFRAEIKPELGIIRPDQHLGDLLKESKAVYSIAKEGIYYLNVTAYRASGRIRAVVYQGEDMAEIAGNALNALANSQTLALQATSRVVKEASIETTSTLFYDNGRYYQRTENNTDGAIRIQESLFDGNTGWSRIRNSDKQALKWAQSSEVSPEPELLNELRLNASKLIYESEIYESISYLEGSFICFMANEYLETLGKDSKITTFTLGNLYIEIDESTQKATFFRLLYNYVEEQDNKLVSGEIEFSIKVLENAESASEIEKQLGYL